MITLSSDFGSPYPAAMKGVLLGRTDARLVDVAHDFPRQDVRAAAFWLREVLPYFPPAVHLVVVDPSVGTDRKALVVRAGEHLLVGPDNGVLLPAARRIATGDDELAVYEWTYEDPDSATFHGRDVFAPAAAGVHEAGIGRFTDLDPVEPLADCIDLQFPEPDVGADRVAGEVLAVDGFGNAISNVPGDAVAGLDEVTVNGQRAPVRRAYAEVDRGQRLVTVGSHGNVEFAVNRGRGDEAFALEAGDEVALSW